MCPDTARANTLPQHRALPALSLGPGRDALHPPVAQLASPCPQQPPLRATNSVSMGSYSPLSSKRRSRL